MPPKYVLETDFLGFLLHGGFLLLLFLSILSCSDTEKPVQLMSQSQPTKEGTKVLYEIGGTRFSIPIEYHYSVYRKFGAWPQPKKEYTKVEGFDLVAILPDLSPFSSSNRYEFEKPGFGSRLELSIREDDASLLSLSSYLARLSERGVLEEKGDGPRLDGLVHYVDYKFFDRQNGRKAPEKDWDDLFLFPEWNEKKYFLMRCGRSGVSQNCKVVEQWRGRFIVEYSFNRDRMSEWKEIRKNLFVLLEAFLK
jgi:hypothetical protein